MLGGVRGRELIAPSYSIEVRQVIWCSYLETGVLVPLRFGIIDTEGLNGNGLHTLIL